MRVSLGPASDVHIYRCADHLHAADCDRHRDTAAICALNILLGWTALGWISAFVWSLTYSPPPLTTAERLRAIELAIADGEIAT
jgi:hypothetical protein